MKYVRETGIIFTITLIGEALNHFLPLPVPAGVYGLFLLLVLLCVGIIKLEDIEATGNFLLDIMPLLFIPASVGVLDNYNDIKTILAPIVIICAVSTTFVMVVTGKMAELVIKLGKGFSSGRQGGKQS